ncbi:MAG: hypothetical protein Ct9H300mP27_03660 [Chloroflexota bacterium]|nr:MAG: hypothetical protein Ct9H300mP27_03660 [Chloroflexota bacterium]
MSDIAKLDPEYLDWIVYGVFNEDLKRLVEETIKHEQIPVCLLELWTWLWETSPLRINLKRLLIKKITLILPGRFQRSLFDRSRRNSRTLGLIVGAH